MANTNPAETSFAWKRFVRQALLLAVIMMSSLGGYLLVLKWRGGDARIVTHVAWDDLLPYEPAWVWVYLIPYLIGPVLVGLFRAATFRWYVERGLAIVTLTLLIFMVLPTQTAARPSEHGLGSGLTATLYQNMIEIDEPPANAAPSLHVSLTCLLALALFLDFPRWWPLTVAGVLLVWLATLLTRQHHLIDVATGALLALVVVGLWPRPRSPLASG